MDIKYSVNFIILFSAGALAAAVALYGAACSGPISYACRESNVFTMFH